MTVPGSPASERSAHRTRPPAPRERGIPRNQEPCGPLTATPAETLLRALLGANAAELTAARGSNLG